VVAARFPRRDPARGRLQVMKLVTAIIRPSKLDEVVDALSGLGVDKLTVTEVRGFDRPGRGADASPSPGEMVEVAVPDERLRAVIEAVRAAARTGRAGDGVMFVTDLLRAVRIRNRESGEQAL
jgi:nitrogen regulatory protein P-II 2